MIETQRRSDSGRVRAAAWAAGRVASHPCRSRLEPVWEEPEWEEPEYQSRLEMQEVNLKASGSEPQPDGGVSAVAFPLTGPEEDIPPPQCRDTGLAFIREAL